MKPKGISKCSDYGTQQRPSKVTEFQPIRSVGSNSSLWGAGDLLSSAAVCLSSSTISVCAYSVRLFTPARCQWVSWRGHGFESLWRSWTRRHPLIWPPSVKLQRGRTTMAVGGAGPLLSSGIAAPQQKKREVLLRIRMNISFWFTDAFW